MKLPLVTIGLVVLAFYVTASDLQISEEVINEGNEGDEKFKIKFGKHKMSFGKKKKPTPAPAVADLLQVEDNEEDEKFKIKFGKHKMSFGKKKKPTPAPAVADLLQVEDNEDDE